MKTPASYFPSQAPVKNQWRGQMLLRAYEAYPETSRLYECESLFWPLRTVSFWILRGKGGEIGGGRWWGDEKTWELLDRLPTLHLHCLRLTVLEYRSERQCIYMFKLLSNIAPHRSPQKTLFQLISSGLAFTAHLDLWRQLVAKILKLKFIKSTVGNWHLVRNFFY